MTKKYIIIKLETKESEVPNGYHTTTRTEYLGVSLGYPLEYDTLEEAESSLASEYLGRPLYEKYTIIPIYGTQA